jgi:signal transduction histidine kinase
MKLATFIVANMDAIVKEFVSFASTLEPAALGKSVSELQDHAREILLTLAANLDISETPEQKRDKSIGQVSEIDAPDTAAAAHGADRQLSGFTLPQLTAEYRALRASVLRLWMPETIALTKESAAQIACFHEGIDQALQESAIEFAKKNDRARDTFLAILGHDLRSPLATITMAGKFLTSEGEGTERTVQIGARVRRSAAAMTTMVNDLLEYARTELGGKIPVSQSRGDLRTICQAAVDEATVAHPDCDFKLSFEGVTTGDFDASRLSQVFSNLLNNAAQYRSDGTPVALHVKGDQNQWAISVTNFGRTISAEGQRVMFNPLVQLTVSSDQKGPASTSIGLGLFIAREIAIAHGGSISLESNDQNGTVFTVRLPRAA